MPDYTLVSILVSKLQFQKEEEGGRKGILKVE
jgi:hypothetical protein